MCIEYDSGEKSDSHRQRMSLNILASFAFFPVEVYRPLSKVGTFTLWDGKDPPEPYKWVAGQGLATLVVHP